MEFLNETVYLRIFGKKSVKKIQISLKSDKNLRVHHVKTDIHVRYLAEFFLEREMFQAKVVEKIKTNILCSVTFFFYENRVVYEIM